MKPVVNVFTLRCCPIDDPNSNMESEGRDECDIFTPERTQDCHNRFLVQTDQLNAMLATEHTYNLKPIPCQSRKRPPDLGDWRRKICQWEFRVVDHFRLDRDVVAISMDLFDRFLHQHPTKLPGTCPCPACKRLVDSRTYQLAAMTCLYIAIKLSARTCKSRHFRLSSFAELSRGQFLVADVCEMEEIVLATLRWKVHPPTSMVFISYWLSTLWGEDTDCEAVAVVRELARYQTEYAVWQGQSGTSSQLAAASILAALDLLNDSAVPAHIRHRIVSALRHRVVHRIIAPEWPDFLWEASPLALARDYGWLLLDHRPVTPPPKIPLQPESPVSVTAATAASGHNHLLQQQQQQRQAR